MQCFSLCHASVLACVTCNVLDCVMCSVLVCVMCSVLTCDMCAVFEHVMCSSPVSVMYSFSLSPVLSVVFSPFSARFFVCVCVPISSDRPEPLNPCKAIERNASMCHHYTTLSEL